MPAGELQRVLDKLDKLEESVGEIKSAVAVLKAIEDREWPQARQHLSKMDGRIGELERKAAHSRGWIAGATAGGGALGFLASKLATWLQ